MDEMAGYIRAEVDRMNGLVSRFLDFARPLRIHPAEADLREVLREVEREQAELAAERGVSVAIENDGDRLVFRFDRNLLRVALSNFSAESNSGACAWGESFDSLRNGPQEVTIWVSDQGEGIAREHLESIFNPFFAMKTKGVGLGLALVAKVVDEHGGSIHVERAGERGAI